MALPLGMAELPDSRQLRAAAVQLREAAMSLQPPQTEARSFADAIGPALWQDSNSQAAAREIRSVAERAERSAYRLLEASASLEGVATTVASHEARYAAIAAAHGQAQLAALTDAGATSATQLIALTEEQQAIERSVRAAVLHASAVLNRVAAEAYEAPSSGGEGVSGFLGGLVDRVRQKVSSFVDGLSGEAQGTAAAAGGLFAFFNRYWTGRLIADPGGWTRDVRQGLTGTAHGALDFAQAVRRDPVGVAREVGKSVIGWDDLQSDPARWLGGMAFGLATGGVSKAVRAGQGGASALRSIGPDEVARAGAAVIAGNAAAGRTLDMATLVDDQFSISRYEGQGFLGMRPHNELGHIEGKHVVPAGRDPILHAESELAHRSTDKPSRVYEGYFESDAKASYYVGQGLIQNQASIKNWLTDSSHTKVFEVNAHFPETVGWAGQRNFSDMQNYGLHGSSHIRMYLWKSTSMPEGFIVQTSFPTYK